jgi:hypothetical protein
MADPASYAEAAVCASDSPKLSEFPAGRRRCRAAVGPGAHPGRRALRPGWQGMIRGPMPALRGPRVIGDDA